MADLRTLLHQSAPKPRSPLDLVSIHERVQRRPHRRFAAWLGIAGLLLGLGVPGGSALVTADRQNDRQAAPPSLPSLIESGHVDSGVDVPTTTSTQIASARSTARPSTESKAVEASAAGSGSAEADDSARVIAPPTTARGPAATTSTVVAPSPSPADYPRAASCSIDNAGLGRNEQRRCRFTATATGGAGFRDGSDEPRGPTAQVSVTRDGSTMTRPVTGVAVFAGDLKRGCAEQFIQPGDLVELVLTNSGSDSEAEATVGAGEGWECGSSPSR